MANINVKINNEVFKLNSKSIYSNGFGGTSENPVLYISHAAAGQLVKQYVKKNYPHVVCRVTSDSFSMGNSLRVYLSTPTGQSVSQEIYEDVNSFAHLWEYGSFNGMYDIYECYENSGAVSDKGTTLKAGVKYVFVENQPRFDTVEWALNEAMEGRDWEDVIRYMTPKTAERARIQYETINQ